MDTTALVNNTYSSHLHDSNNIFHTHRKPQLTLLA